MRRIGILGGSFNPAHEGHLHISRLALDLLGLDEIWWMVSPQNPLKTSTDMASLKERMKSARHMAEDPRIVVSDIEQQLGTRYSADTLRVLKQRYPGDRFVWIMGADNLVQIPKWKMWRRIFRTVPIAVFARPPYSLPARSGLAARRFARERVRQSRAKSLVMMKPPAWVFLKVPEHAASSTRIRASRTGKPA